MFKVQATRLFFIVLSLLALAACQSTPSTPDDPLIGTYWKLMSIGGQPVTVAEGQREPYMVLQRHEQSVHGHSGCNALSGHYSQHHNRLQFSRIVSTRMFCADAMATEKAFVDLLQREVEPRIDGNRLTLMDDNGEALARFESRLMQ